MTRSVYDSRDPFDVPEKKPTWSWRDRSVGFVAKFKVTGEAREAQQRDFDTDEPAVWPDGNPKMAAVLDVEYNGEEYALWAPRPSALFNALVTARKAAGGASFASGGLLEVKLTEERKNPDKPKLNPQKIFAAKYTPPAEADPFDDDTPPF